MPRFDADPQVGIPAFSHAMRLHRVDPTTGPVPLADDARTVFLAALNPHWTIGSKIHGGVMLSLCAKAAGLALAPTDGLAPTPARRPIAPLAISASFLFAPDPGAVRLVATVRRHGRQVNFVDVELVQRDRVAVRAAVTVGVTEPDEQPLLVANPIAEQLSPEPPPEFPPIDPSHPMAEINHLAAGCDIRPDVSDLWSDAPRARFWVRPRGEQPDALFALMCGDLSMPMTFGVGRTGWAPTVQLTAYVRGAPAPGWLRVVSSTTQIGQTWFDEDHTVVDCSGRIVVQTRQLALVPAP
jgi:acyl-coenzyme A thioesterase PaaI-like protein